MIFNGTADSVRPYTGIDGYLQAVDDAASYWVGYNNIDAAPQVTNISSSGMTIEYSLYSGGDEGTSVSVFKVLDGGHVWFDFEIDGVNSTRHIWDILSQYDLQGFRQ